MAVTVVEPECQLLEGGRRAKIVLTAAGIEELQAHGARNLAVEQAGRLGLVGGGISQTSGTYPVNAAGKMTDDVVMGKEPVAAYRIDYDVRSAR